jgi:hypothetical protein
MQASPGLTPLSRGHSASSQEQSCGRLTAAIVTRTKGLDCRQLDLGSDTPLTFHHFASRTEIGWFSRMRRVSHRQPHFWKLEIHGEPPENRAPIFGGSDGFCQKKPAACESPEDAFG